MSQKRSIALTLTNTLLLGILICLVILIFTLKTQNKMNELPSRYDQDRVGKVTDASLAADLANEARIRAEKEYGKEQ